MLEINTYIASDLIIKMVEFDKSLVNIDYEDIYLIKSVYSAAYSMTSVLDLCNCVRFSPSSDFVFHLDKKRGLVTLGAPSSL